jgi:hypothetical protein
MIHVLGEPLSPSVPACLRSGYSKVAAFFCVVAMCYYGVVLHEAFADPGPASDAPQSAEKPSSTLLMRKSGPSVAAPLKGVTKPVAYPVCPLVAKWLADELGEEEDGSDWPPVPRGPIMGGAKAELNQLILEICNGTYLGERPTHPRARHGTLVGAHIDYCESLYSHRLL